MSFSLAPLFTIKKKHFYIILASTLINSTLGFPGFAQVNVNQSALNNLGPTKKNTVHKTQKKSVTNHKKRTEHKKSSEPKHSSSSSEQQTHHQNQPPTPSIPNAPPPIPVFKDANLSVPLHPPSPPPMPKIVPNAPGNVVTNNQHTIINFAGDSADLNEAMMKAIMDVANTLKQHANTQIYLNAYSHGTPDDISTPRRNALNRGLVIRAVLINQGIPTTRIYLMVKGIPQNNNVKNADYVEMIRADLLKNKNQ